MPEFVGLATKDEGHERTEAVGFYLVSFRHRPSNLISPSWKGGREQAEDTR
jgi:hypothetical protein